MVARFSTRYRPAFTIAEIMVAMAVIVVLVVVVGQCMALSLRERAQIAAHQAAVELAANILEAARAQPWEQLDQQWAASQAVPPEMANLLPEGKVIVTVEIGQPHPLTRRITVEVRWQIDANFPPEIVQLTTVISGRSTKSKEVEP
jgi:type II secretory pathway pseudopilin PulG